MNTRWFMHLLSVEQSLIRRYFLDSDSVVQARGGGTRYGPACLTFPGDIAISRKHLLFDAQPTQNNTIATINLVDYHPYGRTNTIERDCTRKFVRMLQSVPQFSHHPDTRRSYLSFKWSRASQGVCISTSVICPSICLFVMLIMIWGSEKKIYIDSF